jgi:hypothetical protein
MLEVLASVSPARTDDTAALQAALAPRLPMISGCICVLLGWDEDRHRLVAWLRSRGVAVEVFAVRDGPERPDPGPLRDTPRRYHSVQAGRLEEALAWS